MKKLSVCIGAILALALSLDGCSGSTCGTDGRSSVNASETLMPVPSSGNILASNPIINAGEGKPIEPNSIPLDISRKETIDAGKVPPATSAEAVVKDESFAIKRNLRQFQSCFEAVYKKGGPKAAYMYKLRLIIQSDGSIDAEPSNVSDKVFDECVGQAAKSMRFPSFDGGTKTIIVPFVGDP